MFKLPSLLKYPIIMPVHDCPQIINKFCYVVEDYKPGLAVVIKREDGVDGIIAGDWNGNIIGMDSAEWSRVQSFLSNCNIKLIQMMSYAGMKQAQFFISEDGRLVDVQLSLNRFIGPGMLRDLFSSTMPIPNILELTTIDSNKIENLSNVVLKPSKFRTYTHNDLEIPLYARV